MPTEDDVANLDAPGVIQMSIALDGKPSMAVMSPEQSPEQAARVFCRSHGLHENPRYDEFLQIVGNALAAKRREQEGAADPFAEEELAQPD